MGRPERPLDDTGGPIAEFARDLRELRISAGNPSYRELARRALFVPSVLSGAASGFRLPTLPVTLAFVAACGGDSAVWERRWRAVAGSLQSSGMGTGAGAAGPAAGQPRNVSGSGPGSRQASAAPIHGVADDRSAIRATLPNSAARRPVPPVTLIARPAQLPIGPGLLVGRADALARAGEVVGRAGDARIPLVIRGPIGVGKTVLALRIAAEYSAWFPDGQLYADLSNCGAGNQSTDTVLRGFLRALGVPSELVPDDPTQRIGLYRSLLTERGLFVLLENARDEGQVRPLLACTPRSQVVVTARARLLGLESTRFVDLRPLDRMASTRLLERLIGTARAGRERAALDEVADLCADLPLALGIIGRKLAARPEWTVGHAAALLADRDRLLGILRIGDVSVWERLAAAYWLLTPDRREAVHLLGTADRSGKAASDLADAMGITAEEADEVLDSLVDSGLAARAATAGRYSVSRLVGAFAASTGPGPGSDQEPPAMTPAEGWGRRMGTETPPHVARRQERAHAVRL